MKTLNAPKIDLTDVATIDINKNGKITDEQSKRLDIFYQGKYKSLQVLSALGFVLVGFIWFAITHAQWVVNQQVSFGLWVIGFLLFISAFVINRNLETKRLAVPENAYHVWNKQIQNTTAICLSRHATNGTLSFFSEDFGKQLTLGVPEKAVFKEAIVPYKVYYVDKYLLSLEPLVDEELFLKTYNAWLRYKYNFSEESFNTNADNRLTRKQSTRTVIQVFLLGLSGLVIFIVGIAFCILSIVGVFLAIPFALFFIFLFVMVYAYIRQGFDLKAYKGLVTWATRGSPTTRTWHLVLIESEQKLSVFPHQISGFISGVYQVYYLQGFVLSIQLLSLQKASRDRIQPTPKKHRGRGGGFAAE